MTDLPTGSEQPRRGPVLALLAALRPKQWIKNLFVFGPLLFSRRMREFTTDLRALTAFVLFCLASSAVYILNDVMDVEADRQHPRKRFRPIAAGEISRSSALTLALLLVVVVLICSLLLSPVFAALILTYMVLNTAYSLGLKQVVIIDVMIIGAGFVLRVLGGAAAIGVSPSHWLVLCTILLSVFLGFTKRRAELTLLQDKASDHREVLYRYSPAFLDQMVSVVTAATLMCYILYTVDARTLRVVTGESRGLLLTVPFVMYGIFRYLYVVYRLERGGSPTTALLHDKMLLACIALWALLCMAVIYSPEHFKGWFSREVDQVAKNNPEKSAHE